jgi:hypothetical protein
MPSVILFTQFQPLIGSPWSCFFPVPSPFLMTYSCKICIFTHTDGTAKFRVPAHSSRIFYTRKHQECLWGPSRLVSNKYFILSPRSLRGEVDVDLKWCETCSTRNTIRPKGVLPNAGTSVLYLYQKGFLFISIILIIRYVRSALFLRSYVG